MRDDKLAFIDAELTANAAQLNEIAATVTRADIDAVVASDTPDEAKAAKLLGVVRLLTDKDRDDIRDYTKAALAVIDPQKVIEIPQITS